MRPLAKRLKGAALALLSWGACGAAPAWAQEAQALSLEACLRLAEAHNPTLSAEALAAQASEAQRLQVLHRFGFALEASPSLSRQNAPTANTFLTGGVSTLEEWNSDARMALRQQLRSGGNWAVELGMGSLSTNSQRVDFNPSHRPELALSLNQPLWRSAWAGELELERARLEAEAGLEGLRQARWRLGLALRLAYGEWWAASQALAVHRQSLSGTRQVLGWAQAKVAAGVWPPSERLASEAAVALREAELLEAQAELALAEDRLWGLLGQQGAGRPGGQHRPVPPGPTGLPTPPSAEAAWRQAQAARPDLRLAQLEEARQGQLVALAHRAMQPQLDLKLRASTTNVAANPLAAWGGLPSLSYLDLQAGLLAAWPLGPNPAADAFLAAQLQQARAQALREAAQQQAQGELRLALREAQLAASRQRATALARRFAEAKVGAEGARLRAGMGNAFQLLSHHNDLQAARLAEARAQVQAWQAEAKLQAALGALR